MRSAQLFSDPGFLIWDDQLRVTFTPLTSFHRPQGDPREVHEDADVVHVAAVAAIASSAGLLGGIGDILFDDTTPAPSVPEPSGALVMGVALVVVLVAGRRFRR
jgi:hypothetical protein